MRTLQGHAAGALGVHGQMGCMCCRVDDNTVRIWLFGDGSRSHPARAYRGVRSVACARWDACGVASGQAVRIWLFGDGSLVPLQGHTAGCLGVHGARWVHVCRRRATRAVWLFGDGSVAPCKGIPGGALGVHGARWDACCRVMRQHVQISLRILVVIAPWKGYRAGALGVCADGMHVVSASQDKTVRIWLLEMGLCGTLQGHATGALGVQAPVGCMCVGVGRQHCADLAVWRWVSGAHLQGHAGR